MLIQWHCGFNGTVDRAVTRACTYTDLVRASRVRSCSFIECSAIGHMCTKSGAQRDVVLN